MSLTAIVAHSDDGIIGVEGESGPTLPWHISADLERFKALTTGHAIIMGRKTFDSIGRRGLPNRTSIVLSRSPGESACSNVVWTTSTSAALAAALAFDPHPFVIGGAEIYRQFWPLLTRLELTEVHTTVGHGVHLDLDREQWREMAVSVEQEESGLRFHFFSYARREHGGGDGPS